MPYKDKAKKKEWSKAYNAKHYQANRAKRDAYTKKYRADRPTWTSQQWENKGKLRRSYIVMMYAQLAFDREDLMDPLTLLIQREEEANAKHSPDLP